MWAGTRELFEGQPSAQGRPAVQWKVSTRLWNQPRGHCPEPGLEAPQGPERGQRAPDPGAVRVVSTPLPPGLPDAVGQAAWAGGRFAKTQLCPGQALLLLHPAHPLLTTASSAGREGAAGAQASTFHAP